MIALAVVVVTIIFYGVNFFLYLSLKKGKQRQFQEQFALYFAVNMSLIFLGTIVIVLLRIIEVGSVVSL